MGKNHKTIQDRADADAISPFERFLAELSARFITLPAAEVDAAINDALRRIAELIGADRAQQIRFSADGAVTITHSGALAGVPPVAPTTVTEFYPWVARRLRNGECVVIPDVNALPDEAAIDRSRLLQIGAKSNLCVPLRIAGRIEGAIAFGALRERRDWSPALVERVAMVGDVFANALDHKRAQEALDASVRFEQRMSAVLASLSTCGRAQIGRAIEAGLGDIAQAFGAQRATLWQRDPEGDGFVKTHRWLADDAPRPAEIMRDDRLLWIRAELIAGRVVRFASYAELPPEADADVTTLRKLVIRSAVIVPLMASDRVVGALSFASASTDRAWPDALVPRIKLLGEVFSTVFARDAAERREQDAQAQAAHAARVGTMGLLAASLIHELTQPLAASLANAETAADLLSSPAPDLDEVRGAVADIVSDDRRVGELIQQLRRFLRRGEAERVDIDVRDAVDDALHLVAHDAAEKRVAIDVTVEPVLPAVAADRVQIQQVLLNLLSNACDAVVDSGDESRQIAVTVRAVAGGIAIEVADRGPGMDEATLGRIFQPFFTTKAKGMGLGLSISRSIVASHGGKLSVRSTVGAGTTFRLELPSRIRAVTEDVERRASTSATAPVSVIYVIDDDASMRRALDRQLASAGYRVVAFESAQAFLDYPRAPGVGCIISDVRMPGLTGLDLQASLAEAQCDLPIVFVSGHGDVSTTVQALRAGAVNFLAKPFTKSALLAAVAEALARSQAGADRAAKRDDLRKRYESMTPREREVFTLVAAGLPNKLIADRLGAAEATVKIHRGRMMEKMAAASIADIVRMAGALSGAAAESLDVRAAGRLG